jgi:hypothetical protein
MRSKAPQIVRQSCPVLSAWSRKESASPRRACRSSLSAAAAQASDRRALTARRRKDAAEWLPLANCLRSGGPREFAHGAPPGADREICDLRASSGLGGGRRACPASHKPRNLPRWARTTETWGTANGPSATIRLEPAFLRSAVICSGRRSAGRSSEILTTPPDPPGGTVSAAAHARGAFRHRMSRPQSTSNSGCRAMIPKMQASAARGVWFAPDPGGIGASRGVARGSPGKGKTRGKLLIPSMHIGVGHPRAGRGGRWGIPSEVRSDEV